MGAVCSSQHHFVDSGGQRYDDHISLNKSVQDHHSLHNFSPKLQFKKKQIPIRTSITSEEFEGIQERASSEMKKANSFRIPSVRVSFIGLNSHPTSPSKAKTQEELNLELSTSFLPQHLLYCLRYIYYGGEGREYRVKLGHCLQKTLSNEGLDNESKFSSFLSISTGSNSKSSDIPIITTSSPTSAAPIPSSSSTTNSNVNNSDSRSSSPTRGALVNNRKKSSSPGINLWKKLKGGTTSTTKPVEEEKMKLLSPMSEFSYDTCVLLIEMKGFSKIVDSFFDVKDKCDVSEISRYIYYIYTSLIAIIYEMGGDIEKFQGDLILCQFYSPRMDRTFTDSILAAVKCGLKIQSMTNLKNHKSNDTPLEFKCVVSVGECTSYHLGGFGSQWLRIFGGDIVLRVRELLTNCKQGNVYICSDVYDKCKQFLRATEDFTGLYHVNSLSREISAHPLDSVSFHYTFANALFLFMNRNVMYGIETKTLDTFNSVVESILCTVSIKTGSFGCGGDFDLHTKNNIVNSIQVVSEQYNCCLLDMFFDRKGLKFILNFERHSAETNPSLVIQCLKEVIQRENLLVEGVGFASGYGYRASVGSDFRRHFGLYGELINRTISYCNYAIDHLESGIICDGTTASILDDVCTIRFLGTCEIEGGKTQKLHLILMHEPPPHLEISKVENTGTIRVSDTNTNIYLNIDNSTDVHSMNSVQISEDKSS